MPATTSTPTKRTVMFHAPFADEDTIMDLLAQVVVSLNEHAIVEHVASNDFRLAWVDVTFAHAGEIDSLTAAAHSVAQHVTSCTMEIIPDER